MSNLQERFDIICNREEDFHTRKRAFMVLLDEAERGSPEAAKLVPKAYINCGGRIAHAIREDLLALRNSKARVEFCKEWLSSRNRYLKSFLSHSGWEVPAEEDLKAFFFLNLLQRKKELLYQKLETDWRLCDLAVEAAEDREEDIYRRARYILEKFEYKNEYLINLLARKWVETRSDWIESILLRYKYKPTDSPKVRVLVLLKTSQRHELREANKDIVREVLYACGDKDKDIANEAEKLIAEQKESWGPITLELFSVEDFPEAGKAIVKAGYALPSPEDTALLYFLSGEINAYQEQDPDYTYLQSAYEKASPELRARLRAKLQAIGRPDIASVVLYQKYATRLEQLSYEEWETLIQTLKAAKKLSELWDLVFKAPPHWAAEIVLFLQEAFFIPPSEEERKVFIRLVRLCPEEGKKALFLDPGKQRLDLIAQRQLLDNRNSYPYTKEILGQIDWWQRDAGSTARHEAHEISDQIDWRQPFDSLITGRVILVAKSSVQGWQPFNSSITGLSLSWDGQYVAYSGGKVIAVHHIPSNKEVFRHEVNSNEWQWQMFHSTSANKLLLGILKQLKQRGSYTVIEIWDTSLRSPVFRHETKSSEVSYRLVNDHLVIIAENHKEGTYIHCKSIHPNAQPSSISDTLFQPRQFYIEDVYEVPHKELICILLKPVGSSAKSALLVLDYSTKSHTLIELRYDCSWFWAAYDTYPWLLLKRTEKPEVVPVSLLKSIHGTNSQAPLTVLYNDRYEYNSLQVHYQKYTLRAYFADRVDKKAVIEVGERLNLMNALSYEYPLQTQPNKIDLKVPFMAIGTEKGEIYIFRLPEERRAIGQMTRADYETALANARHPRLPYALQRNWEFLATILEYKLSQEITIEPAKLPLASDTEITLEKE